MTTELALLAWSVVLGLVHAVATGQFTTIQHGLSYGLIPTAVCFDSNVSRPGAGLNGWVCLHDGGGGYDGCDHADGGKRQP